VGQDPSQKPSSEWQIHRRIYEARPDVRAVFHAHPPKATGLAIAGRSLESPILAEAVAMIGPVPLLPYILPGSLELANAVFEGIQQANGLMLANHGIFTVGKDIDEAYYRMELVESLAEMLLVAEQVGGPQILSEHDLATMKRVMQTV
jgi:L-fuculose-phosphate aldolase